MVLVARPTKQMVSDKRLAKSLADLRQIATYESAAMLTTREMVFSRLVAEEGFSYSDAYREAFSPAETATTESINVMACRVHARPRVKAEVERIKSQLLDSARVHDERLAMVMNPDLLIPRIAIELASIGLSDAKDQTRIKALQLLGSMRHVDAFAKAPMIDASSKVQNNTTVNVETVRAEALRRISNLLGLSSPDSQQSPQQDDTSSQVIDI